MSGHAEAETVAETEARLLADLDRRLSGLALEVEVCVVGGAVLPVVFRCGSGTRRPSALFGELQALRFEVEAIGKDTGLGVDWLDRAARRRQRGPGPRLEAFGGANLRIFDPSPEYVLALRCARLADGARAEREELLADVACLARMLGLRSASGVLSTIRPYLPESLLSETLELAVEDLPGLRG